MTVAGSYEERYAERLWSLVPAAYRAADSPSADVPGPLRELLDRVGGQLAVVRASIDRLWEDQSIESCDSWVVPYLAELLATNVVPSMDARGQRLDVANTIYYRRRKGTVALLEQLAHDVTGYDARVIEFFRRMARTRHGLDPQLGWPADEIDPAGACRLQAAQRLTGLLTRTPAGGTADLRHPLGASLTGTAYDEFHHRADVRLGRGALGWYGISTVGFFLWRTVPLAVDRATPVPVAGCPGHYTFDPTGRLIPLFQAGARGSGAYGEAWFPVPSWQLPLPLTEAMWEALTVARGGPAEYPDPEATLWPGSLAVRPTGSGDPLDPAAVRVWPEAGRFHVMDGPADVESSYHYGLFSRIGAGPYDRRQLGLASAGTRADVTDPEPVRRIAGGSAIALPGALGAGDGTIVITDGLTSAAVGTGVPITALTVRAEDRERAVIRPDTADPWVFTGLPGGTLRLEGLLISGIDVVLRGDFDQVTISCCTLDPGSRGDLCTPPVTWAPSADGRELRPVTVWVEGTVRTLVVDRSITGPIRTRTGGLMETVQARDSVIQGLPAASGATLMCRDADGLFGVLRHQRDALSTWLAAQLGPAAAAAVAAHAGGAVPSADLALVLADLQDVVDGPLVWTATRFIGHPLSTSARDAALDPPTGAELAILNRQLLAEAYPLFLADAAIAADAGVTELVRCTVLGSAYLDRLECSESILDDVVRVRDAQAGCVRFSAWATGSALPRRYESVQIAPAAPILVSRRYGEWGYAQVHDGADSAILAATTGGVPSILTGSHVGSEMGVFCRDGAAVKDRSLQIKLREFLPVGLSAVLVHLPAADPDGERTRGMPWPPT
jgi:hypothetical protein